MGRRCRHHSRIRDRCARDVIDAAMPAADRARRHSYKSRLGRINIAVSLLCARGRSRRKIPVFQKFAASAASPCLFPRSDLRRRRACRRARGHPAYRSSASARAASRGARWTTAGHAAAGAHCEARRAHCVARGRYWPAFKSNEEGLGELAVRSPMRPRPGTESPSLDIAAADFTDRNYHCPQKRVLRRALHAMLLRWIGATPSSRSRTPRRARRPAMGHSQGRGERGSGRRRRFFCYFEAKVRAADGACTRSFSSPTMSAR